MTSQEPSSIGSAYRKAGPYLSLGTEFAVTILLCFVLGRWIDGKLDTAPILTLSGFFLGMTAATMNLLRSVNKLHERNRPDVETDVETDVEPDAGESESDDQEG